MQQVHKVFFFFLFFFIYLLFFVILQLTPDGKRVSAVHCKTQTDELPNENNAHIKGSAKANEEDFFDLLTRSQSKRMDDQRCSLRVSMNLRTNTNVI